MLKKIALGALILLAAFVSLCVTALIGEKPFLLLFFTYLAAAIFLPIYYISKFLSARRAKRRTMRRRKKQAETPKPCKPAKQEIIWPDEILNKKCAYRYEHVGVYVPDISVIDHLEVGRIAFLIQEPHNKFDSHAVAVYAAGEKIDENIKVGYLYRGKIQDMANEWEDRGESTFCQISYTNKQSIKPDKDGVKINISFYQ